MLFESAGSGASSRSSSAAGCCRWRRPGPEGTVVVRGAGEVAARARTGARPGALARPVLVDGLPGVLITAGGRPVTVMAFRVTGGAITAIRVLTDPDLLAQVIPSWVA